MILKSFCYQLCHLGASGQEIRVIQLTNRSEPPEDHGRGCTWSSSVGAGGGQKAVPEIRVLVKGGEQ